MDGIVTASEFNNLKQDLLSIQDTIGQVLTIFMLGTACRFFMIRIFKFSMTCELDGFMSFNQNWS